VRPATGPAGASVLALAVGIISFSLAQIAVAPALTDMALDLDRSAAATAWVVTGYFVSAAVLTPVLGRVGDLLGRRRVLIWALLVFALGCALSASAPQLEVIVLGRVLQGVGGGVFPLSFGIVRDLVPAHRRAAAVGGLSALAGLGASAGLLAGGAVTELAGYRWVLGLGAVPAIAAALLIRLVIPDTGSRAPGTVDLPGAVLLGIGLAAPLLALTQATAWGPTDPRTLALAVGGLTVLGLWIRHSLRTSYPLVDLRTCARPALWRTNLATVFVGFAIYSPFLLVTQMAQAPTSTGYGLGLGAAAAGSLVVPGTVLALAAGPLTGRLCAGWGSSRALALGCAVAAAGLIGLALAGGRLVPVLVLCLVTVVGGSMAFAAMPNAIIDAVDPTQTGEATGVNAVARTVGTAIGIQVTAVILAGDTLPGTVLPAGSAYTMAYLAGAATSLVGGVIALTVPRRGGAPPTTREEQPLPAARP
jgi:MFS family permease